MKFNINSSFLYTVQKESYVDEKFYTNIYEREKEGRAKGSLFSWKIESTKSSRHENNDKITI